MMYATGLYLASPCPRVPASAAALGRTRNAFTLIEILSVVIIIGIASAIILPQISARDDLRCAAAARSLMADLLYAQNRSIALQQMHYVQFNKAAGTWQIMAQNSNAPGAVITHPVNGTPYIVTVGTGNLSKVSINSVSFDSQTTLAFDAMGVPYSYNAVTGTAALNAGSVVFKAGVNTISVTVAPFSGEIKVQ